MKISALVVTYNPSNKEVSSIFKLCSLFDSIYIVDNSLNETFNFILNGKKKNIKYIKLKENEGIAKALGVGTDIAIKDKNDLLLTLDQDSIYPCKFHKEIVKKIESLDLKYIGQIHLNENKDYVEEDVSVKDFVITSGTFINLRNYQHTNGFWEELFIDAVDVDISLEFISRGYKNIVLNHYFIEHSVGSKTLKFWNHFYVIEPWYRYYYITRNAYLLKNKYKNKYNQYYFHVNFKVRILFLFFKSHRIKTIFAYICGYIDALRGKTGKWKIHAKLEKN